MKFHFQIVHSQMTGQDFLGKKFRVKILKRSQFPKYILLIGFFSFKRRF